jgi:hypothetical protein
VSTEAAGMAAQESDPAVRAAAAQGDVEYLRRVYASTREWYSAAERKAQLLLTADGAFVTIVFGALIGNAGLTHASPPRVGLAAAIFFAAAGASVVGAIACAGLSMWSLHGRAGSELSRLGIDPDDPCSYKGEALWYFGHLARLGHDAAVSALRQAGQETEAEALSFNVVDLARKVTRKHQWVNAGWALTAAGLIALAGATASLLASA